MVKSNSLELKMERLGKILKTKQPQQPPKSLQGLGNGGKGGLSHCVEEDVRIG